MKQATKNLKIESLQDSRIGIIKAGVAGDFWLQVLKPFLEENKAHIEKRILEDDSLSEEVKITRRDFARFSWGMVKELIEYPNTMISELEESPGDTPMINFMQNGTD